MSSTTKNVVDLMGADARAILAAVEKAAVKAELAAKTADGAESQAALALKAAEKAERAAWAAKQSADGARAEMALCRAAIREHGTAIEGMRTGILEAIAQANRAHRAAEMASDTSEVTGRFASLAVQREQLELQTRQDELEARRVRRNMMWATWGRVLTVLTTGTGIAVLAAAAMKACGG